MVNNQLENDGSPKYPGIEGWGMTAEEWAAVHFSNRLPNQI
jgi:hypothetical protein